MNLPSPSVANSTAAHYIPSGDGQVNFGGTGALSPMLTVWRKLHLEFDAMEDGPPETGSEKNTVSGTILLTHDNEPTSGKSRLVLNQILFNGVNSYAGGTITIEDFGEYSILENTLGYYLPEQRDRVTISAVPGNGTIDKSFVLRDDDDKYLDVLGLPPPLQNDPDGEAFVAAMQPKFDPAYIQLVDANTVGLNPNKRIPFRLNAASAVWPLSSNGFDESKDLTDSSGFWAHSIVLAYQSSSGVDLDPDIEDANMGETPKYPLTFTPFGYSVIYMESIRDAALLSVVPSLLYALPSDYQNDFFSKLYGVTAHEIGHVPGRQSGSADHNEVGLMDEVASDLTYSFRAKTLLRFRSVYSWTQ